MSVGECERECAVPVCVCVRVPSGPSVNTGACYIEQLHHASLLWRLMRELKMVTEVTKVKGELYRCIYDPFDATQSTSRDISVCFFIL